MPIHRIIELPGGVFTADADWAASNVSPDAEGADQVSGLKQRMVVPRAGVEIVWYVSYYDGDTNDSNKVAAPGANFEGEVVQECGSEHLQYKAQEPVTALAVKYCVVEPDLLVGRNAWVRLTAAPATPVGATHIWVGFDLIERRGT